MNLNRLRQQIDRIDQTILKSLNRRLKLAQQIGAAKLAAKQPIFDPKREALLLRQLHQNNTGPLTRKMVNSIYREILSASRAVQKKIRKVKNSKKGAFGSKKSVL